MNSLVTELQNIQHLYDSRFWNELTVLYNLGERASNTGDPSLILSFCHEAHSFFLYHEDVLEVNEILKNEISSAIKLYNSGMGLDYGEYYMSFSFKILKKIKKQICHNT